MEKMSNSLRIKVQLSKEEFGKELIFDQERISIGRDKSCDIVIPMQSVSRQHAEFIYKDDAWFIEDLSSKHGTLVNGKSVAKTQAISASDEIYIGGTLIIVEKIYTPPKKAFEETAFMAQKLVERVLNDRDLPSPEEFLSFLNGTRKDERIIIDYLWPEIIIGSDSSADYQIDDQSVASQHAKITREHNELFVESINAQIVSLNELVIDGKKNLAHGDIVKLGEVQLKYSKPINEAEIFRNEVTKIQAKVPIVTRKKSLLGGADYAAIVLAAAVLISMGGGFFYYLN